MLTPSDIGLPASRFPSYRRGQDMLALDIAGSKRRAVAMAAAPGSGKSLAYMSASLLSGLRTLILVPNKALQSQLMTDFEECGLFDIVGHGNYPCSISDMDYDDSSSEYSITSCRASRGNCNYRDRDIITARASMHVQTNYHHWISIGKSDDPLRLGNFDLIILDEAHEAMDILCQQLAITFSARDISTLLASRMPDVDAGTDRRNDLQTWVEWSQSLLSKARAAYSRMKQSQSDNLSDSSRKTLARLTRLGRDLARLAEVSPSESWVIHANGDLYTELRPVWGAPYAERYLFRGASKIVLSSGTLSKLDADYLGIRSDSLHFIDVPSTFAVNRRPFYYIPTTRVQHDMLEGQQRQIVNRIDKMIETRQTVNGIVHSHSYDYAEMVMRLSKHRQASPSILITHKSRDTQRAVDKFRKSLPPSVLVSPTIGQGFDFIGDLARWQFLMKVPWLNKKGKTIDCLLNARRAKEDRRYETAAVSRKITQAYMRIVRSESDWGETVCCDDHFAHFRKHGVFPQWFRAAWRVVDRIPEPLKVSQ